MACVIEYPPDFGRAADLKKHIRYVHEGVKNHKCEKCGKAFTKPGELKIHISSVHEGVKNHKCNICGKTFSQAGNLNKHSCVHEKVKNHKCVTCDKAFGMSGSLKRHIRTVHAEMKNQKLRYPTPHPKNDEHTKAPISNEHNIKTEFLDSKINILHSDIEIKEEPI